MEVDELNVIDNSIAINIVYTRVAHIFDIVKIMYPMIKRFHISFLFYIYNSYGLLSYYNAAFP